MKLKINKKRCFLKKIENRENKISFYSFKRIELETKLDALVTVMSAKLNGLLFSKDECSWLSNITHRLSAYFYSINKFENALTLAHFSVILFEDEDKDCLLLCLNEVNFFF